MWLLQKEGGPVCPISDGDAKPNQEDGRPRQGSALSKTLSRPKIALVSSLLSFISFVLHWSVIKLEGSSTLFFGFPVWKITNNH